MNTNNNNGLYPHDVAKQLYKNGNMPYWAYVQLYATKEEAIEIFEERKKNLIDDYYKQKEIERQQEEQKKAEKQFIKAAEKQIEKEIGKTLDDLLKPFSK